MLWFTSILFYVAVQRQVDVARLVLSILHIGGVVVALQLGSVSFVPFNHLFVPWAIIGTLHTASVLLLEKKILKLPSSTSFAQRPRAVLCIWANPRGLCLSDDTCTDSPDPGHPGRVRFALLRCGRAIALLAIRHLIASFTTKTLYGLHLSRWDFGPDNQGLLPLLTKRDLILRLLMSYQWVWDTHILLTVAHNLLAAVFVSVMQWDRPDDWPALFGNITQAYTLRRFWGQFWHRLHVTIFEAYLAAMVIRVKVRSPVFPFYRHADN